MPRRPIGRRPGRPLGRLILRRAVRGIQEHGTPRGDIPPALIVAHQLLSSGQYAEAGTAYLDLANRGVEHGIRQAPNLYFQAARCYILADDSIKALEIIRSGFEAFARENRWVDLYRSGLRITNMLNDNHLIREAEIVSGWVKELIPPQVLSRLKSEPAREPSPSLKSILPTHCPSCGGTVNPKEVEWVDDKSAMCDYCGSIVRSE